MPKRISSLVKRFIALALSLCLVLSFSLPTAWALEFSDMPEADHWSYTALEAAVENGLLNGSDGKLMPGGVLTRAQMAAIVNRAFGATDVEDIGGFSDVKTTDWFFTDIAKAVRMGTFQGDENGLMNPDSPVTREQAFTALARAFHLENGSAKALAPFADANEISGYAVGPVAALVAAGYVTGSSGKLLPKDTITRAEFAQVIYNMIRHYIGEEGIYTGDYDGNVMVNVPGVTLKDLTIDGDLIIGEGVGNGETTLDGVQIRGRLLVRGGGENSIVIKNSSEVGHVILSKTGDGGVRLYTEEGCRVEVVYIPDGKDDIILEGTFNQVSVDTDTPVVLKSASITGLTVSAENADIQTEGNTEITTVVIEETAVGAAIEVDDSSTIINLESDAENVTIDGDGTVVQASVNGDNTDVNTEGTKVTIGEDAQGVTVGGEEVESGTTIDPSVPDTPTIPDIPDIPSVPDNPSVPDEPDKPDVPDKPDEPDGFTGEIEVSTLEELKDALKSYAVITIIGSITAAKEDLTVAKEQTLVIEQALTLDQESTLTVNGVLVNKRFFDLLNASELTVSGTFEAGENARMDCTSATVTVEKGGLFNNYGSFHMTGGSLVNNGVFNNGKATQTGTTWYLLYAYSAEVINNGTFVNEAGMWFRNMEDMDEAPAFTNNGKFVNGALQNGDAYFEMNEGTFRSCGHFVSNDFIDISYSDFSHEGDEMFESSNGLYIVGGSFDVSEADAGTFKNTGWMTIVDEYGEVDNICQIDLGERNAFHNDTCFLYYRADVYTEDGMRRAEEAQLAKKEKAETESSYFGFDDYDGINLRSDISITEDTTLGAFSQYRLQGTWTWDSELQQTVLTPATLSVASGVTVTMENSYLYASAGGGIANDGCVTTAEGCYGGIEIGDGGSYTGNGEVTGAFHVYYYEGTVQEDAYDDYYSYTVAIAGDAVYTVDQDTDINTVYSVSDDTEIVVFGHNGTLSGSALANAERRANVTTFAGLKGAAKADIDGAVFNWVNVWGDTRITIREDLAIDRMVNIYSNTGLIIPYGVTLTINNYLNSSGDISVDGTLVIGENAQAFIQSTGNLEVGALTGDEIGMIVVYGYLRNNGYMHLYATGQLINGGEGWFANDGELVEDPGSVNDFG